MFFSETRCSIVSFILSKAYLNMATFRISVLLLKKSWTLWYIERLPTSLYTGVIHFLNVQVFWPTLYTLYNKCGITRWCKRSSARLQKGKYTLETRYSNGRFGIERHAYWKLRRPISVVGLFHPNHWTDLHKITLVDRTCHDHCYRLVRFELFTTSPLKFIGFDNER